MLYYKLMIIDCGHIWSCGSNIYGEAGVNLRSPFISPPQRIMTPSNVCKMFVRNMKAFCITATGRLFAWGKNEQFVRIPSVLEAKVWKPEPLSSSIFDGQNVTQVAVASSFQIFLTGMFMLNDDDEFQ